MADLKRKLARLGDAGPGSGDRRCEEKTRAPSEDFTSRQVRIEKLRTAIEGIATRKGRRSPPETSRASDAAAVPGALQHTAHGPVHLIERYLEPHHCHGCVPVRGALEARSESVARLALDPALEPLELARMVFVDTETTGLAGGTGTIPFLVGMAWFEDESLRVQQLFLRRPGEEAPMLRLLADRIGSATCIVSYNGKSFDWPLMRNRFVLNRVAMPEPPPHLDLLHCARRLFRRRMDSVRLVDLERELLGFEREGDVDGCEIPGIYLRYLRGGEHRAMTSVVAHNELDLVALAALIARLADRYEQVRGDDDPRDHLGYAEVAARAGDTERAGRFARAAAEGGGDADCTTQAWMLAARVARHRRSVDEEERALLRAAEAADDERQRADAHLALAKFYEHRRKDPVRALEHASYTAMAEGEDARARRIARLRRRFARRRW